VLRLMSYERSFRQLRTHVLCEEAPSGRLDHDRDQVYAALRAGRCYLALDSLGPARGFRFTAAGPGGEQPMGAEAAAGEHLFRAVVPAPASLRLLCDGVQVAAAEDATELAHEAGGPGVYRVEARRRAHGRPRTWVLSNPIYLR
jgi:hypothetical protein